MAVAHSSYSISAALRSFLAISTTSPAWWNMLLQWQLAGWSWWDKCDTGYDDDGGEDKAVSSVFQSA